MTVVSTFAEQQLAKYGWKKGDGLGKDGAGIKRAITVSRRADNRGIGSDANQWNSNWWDHLYNKATVNVTAAATAISAEEVVYQEKMAEAAKEKDTLSEYQGMFVRSATDTPTGQSSGTSTPVPSNGRGQPVDRTKLVRDGNVHLGAQLTDAELFAACEGRMARKGARAEQSGKLARVSGSGMPRPEVAARIEAALSGRLPEQIVQVVKTKRKRSRDEDGKEKEKKKRSKSDKKEKRSSDKKEKKEKKRRAKDNKI
ncbi:hypothetical protein IWW38_003133 [Coemansia aciculifera]|uniref:Uncharacterized protein n=1 Tax=Coemansia aciculifera TaxID=417176 RepID=A0ACC1M185_9FUNG|nr:hypothetical protein IWW38_003133 [Coemansia aciculifera]